VVLKPSDAARRQELFRVKLKALIRAGWGEDHVGRDDVVLGPFPGGATLRRGRLGWVLAEEEPERALGGALAWAAQMGVDDVHVLAEGAVGLLARRAAAFTRPPTVWRVQGRSLSRGAPEPLESQPSLPVGAVDFLSTLEQAGVEPVVEHGVLTGEVLGLEVARVVDDDSGVRLEVGVGKFDREVQRLLHGHHPPGQALAGAVAIVRRLRRVGAPGHQANRLVPERWLRSVVVRNPQLVGASWLAPMSPPLPRANLLQRVPAPAGGFEESGAPIVVVCSTGIDVDLVPSAVDSRDEHGQRPRLVLVVPEGDDHPTTRALAAALVEPAEVVTVPRDWRRLPG
jgi:hypothetical protein